MPPSVPVLSAPSTPPTAEQLETGRQLGAAIAKDLVVDINAMGLTAVQAGPGAVPQVGDGVIRGYLVSVEGGSAAKRFVIGFGAGSSEMDTVVEGFAVTAQGWRKLGSGTLSSSGNKMPGMVAPAALAIATGNPLGVIVMGGTKDLWRGERQKHARRESQGDCRRNRGAAQDSIPRAWLDKLTG